MPSNFSVLLGVFFYLPVKSLDVRICRGIYEIFYSDVSQAIDLLRYHTLIKKTKKKPLKPLQVIVECEK